MKHRFLTTPFACLALLACPIHAEEKNKPVSADWSVTVNLPTEGDSNLLRKISTVFGIPQELMPEGSKPSITCGGFDDPATPGKDWFVVCTGIEDLAQRLGESQEFIGKSDEKWHAWMPDDATLVVANTKLEHLPRFEREEDALVFLHLDFAHEEKEGPRSRLLRMISGLDASIIEEGSLLHIEVMAGTSAKFEELADLVEVVGPLARKGAEVAKIDMRDFAVSEAEGELKISLTLDEKDQELLVNYLFEQLEAATAAAEEKSSDE